MLLAQAEIAMEISSRKLMAQVARAGVSRKPADEKFAQPSRATISRGLCVCVRMYVCMYVTMYVCIYVCLYVWIQK